MKCASAGNHRPHPERTVVSPHKKRNRGGLPRSYKHCCKASIIITKELGSESLKIKWNWEHTDHAPTTLAALAEHRMSRATRDWLDTRVEQGFDWKAMKGLLRLEDAALEVRCIHTLPLTPR